MRKVDDGKRKEKNGVFSGHYVIASSLPPEQRPLECRTLVPIESEREIVVWKILFVYPFFHNQHGVMGHLQARIKEDVALILT